MVFCSHSPDSGRDHHSERSKSSGKKKHHKHKSRSRSPARSKDKSGKFKEPLIQDPEQLNEERRYDTTDNAFSTMLYKLYSFLYTLQTRIFTVTDQVYVVMPFVDNYSQGQNSVEYGV